MSDEVEVIMCNASGCDNEATNETYDNEAICDDCSFMCDRCEDTCSSERESYQIVDRTERWCSTCSDYSYYCEGCEEHYSDAGCYVFDRDEYWCERCCDHYAHWCDECEHYTQNGCDQCEEEGYRVIHDYSYRPDPIFHATNDNERLFFGFELEMEFEEGRGSAAEYAHSQLEPIERAYLKSDGSLENGFELVTHPMSFEFLMDDDASKELWDTINKLRVSYDARSYNTRTCGFHVHVSRSGFKGGAHMHRFLNLVYSNPKLYQKLAGRSSDQWAKFDDVYRRYFDENEGIYKLTKSFKQKLSRYRESDRYSAVNTLNEHTLEVRIFKGTMSIPALKAHIQLVHASVEYTRTLSVQQVASGALQCNNFLAYIYANMELYPDLVARIEHKDILPTECRVSPTEEVLDTTMPSIDEVPIIVHDFNESEQRRRLERESARAFEQWLNEITSNTEPHPFNQGQELI